MSSSSWSEIRLRTKNAFGSIIAGLIQKQNEFNAVNLEITDADTIMPRRILTSKAHVNSLISGYARSIEDSHFRFPMEPDGNLLRMWYRFDHMGHPMFDLSYANNNCDVIYDKLAPELITNMYDDGITGGNLHTIVNPYSSSSIGETTYYRVSGDNKIKDIVDAGHDGISIFYRFFPIIFDNEVQSGGTQRAVLFEEIDNDQVEYAMRAEGGLNGHIYFYMRFDSVNYYVDTEDLAEPPLQYIDPPDYNPQDFNSIDYQVGEQLDYIPDVAEFTDVFFVFDFTTKNLKIIKNGVTIGETINNIIVDDVFPESFDDPEPPPPPGTPFDLPFSQVYTNPGTTATYKKANAVTVSGITNVYNVGAGTPISDPVSTVYEVTPGIASGTTTPPATVYSLGGNGSDVTLPEESYAAGQRVKSTSSSMYNKILKDITVYIRTTASSLSGTVKVGIIKSGGAFVQFGADIPGTDLDGSFDTITRSNTSNTYPLAVGDVVGITWTGWDGSSEDVRLQSAGSGTHSESSSYSHFAYSETSGGAWTEDTNRSVAGIFVDKGTSTTINPYLSISGGNSDKDNNYKYYAVGEVFPTGSPAIGNVITDISLRVYRHASATTGTIQLRHADASNAVKGNLGAAVNISTLPTTAPTTYNWTWQDFTYNVPIAANDRIVLVLSGASTNPVYVLGNEGATVAPTSYDTPNTRSCVTYRRAGYPGIFGGFGSYPEAWTTNTARDISGIFKKGGNDYTTYTELWHNRWRAGICVNTGSSSLSGKVITKVTATFKSVGTPPAGSIFCRIRTFTGNIRTTIQQKDVSEVNATDTAIDFINTTHGYVLEPGDLISLEYELGTSTNYIMVRNNTDVFETTNTVMFTVPNSSDTATLLTNRDLTAQLYTGGELDTTARPLVGLRVNHPSSMIAGKAITKAELYLKRVGTFTPGQLGRVKVIRWSDKVTVSVLDTIDLSTISTTETLYPFENTGNSYPLADGDMIAFENTFGDVTNYIQVKISDNNTLDDTKTQMADYDGTTYFHLANDIAGNLYTGGYTVFPDPSIPNPPTPFHYNHKLYIGAGLPDDSQALTDPDNLPPRALSGAYLVMDDFRIYATLIDDEEATNLFTNKYTINAFDFGTIKVIGHDKIEANE